MQLRILLTIKNQTTVPAKYADTTVAGELATAHTNGTKEAKFYNFFLNYKHNYEQCTQVKRGIKAYRCTSKYVSFVYVATQLVQLRDQNDHIPGH